MNATTTDTRVLFILTGHNRLGDDESADLTGFHLSEASHPWSILKDAGVDVEFVTPDGGPAPIDPSSKDLDDPINQRFMQDPGVQIALKTSASLADVDLADFAGLYFPGGHGTMWDLPDNTAVIDAARTIYESGRPLAAVCHGPAAFVNVRLSDGQWLVEGKKISVFTDKEEKATGKDSAMPFLLASKLKERGAKLESADNFEESVSVDGNLITGQNPASADGLGKELLKQLRH